MEILISVIIPVYNNEQYIKRCLDSVAKQTMDEIEVIIIDDGSNDRTAFICSQFINTNKKFSLIRQENTGVSGARNRGIRLAKGKYIAFVDSDDVLAEDYLEELYHNMHQGGLSACDWTSVPLKYNTKGEFTVLTRLEAQQSVLVYKGLEGYPFCKLFDLDVINRNKLQFALDITLCEDVLFVMQYIYYSRGKITRTRRKLYYYFDNPKGALSSRFLPDTPMRKEYLSEYEAIDRCYEFLINKTALSEYYELRKTKAAVAALRVMAAKNYRIKTGLYQNLLSYVRRNCFNYLVRNTGAASSKVSVLICSINPQLEYKVWAKGKYKR